jgi:hypothetical protein
MEQGWLYIGKTLCIPDYVAIAYSLGHRLGNTYGTRPRIKP